MATVTSSTPLSAVAWLWLLLPPILLCKLLHGYGYCYLVPPILLCQLMHGYGNCDRYLQYSSATCCMVMAAVTSSTPLPASAWLWLLLPPILLCQLLHGYGLVGRGFLLNLVFEVFLNILNIFSLLIYGTFHFLISD